LTPMTCFQCAGTGKKTPSVAVCNQYGFGVCEHHKLTCDSAGHGTEPLPAATPGNPIDLAVSVGYLMYPCGDKPAGWYASFILYPDGIYGYGLSAELALDDLIEKLSASGMAEIEKVSPMVRESPSKLPAQVLVLGKKGVV